MALTQQTEWHGNPRPRLAYQWSEFVANVSSPYAVRGATVPTYVHGWSMVPFAEKDDAATGNIDTAGPLAAVAVSLAGPFPVGTVINWTITGDVSGAHADTYTVDSSRSNGMSPEEVAVDIAALINADLGADGTAVATGRVIDMTAAGANTTLTVTTFTVV